MGFVTFASFDDTLSISHKKNIDKSFFSPEISLRTAVTFFMVRSVLMSDVISRNYKPSSVGLQIKRSFFFYRPAASSS